MREVQIGTEHDFLTLVRDDSDVVVDTVIAHLRSGTLSASKQVVLSYAPGFADIVAFFESLSEDWRGWEGERMWDALEGDLSVTATYEYHHVQLRITMRDHGPGWGNLGWEASVSLTLDPGEQLARIAPDLTSLFDRA